MPSSRTTTAREFEKFQKAETELNKLSQRPLLENSVSKMNLKVLKKRFKCCDIYPKITLELMRDQDRAKEGRLDLAIDVARTMATELMQTFTGNKSKSKLVLRVNITAVSDGCSPRRGKIGNLIGRGSAQGKGFAKLAVSYCLFMRRSGKVAVSKQLCKCEQRTLYAAKRAVLMKLEEELRVAISKEVTFTCCSRLPQWNQSSMRMIRSDSVASELDQ